MVSRHFDKQKAQDFGLIIDLKGKAISRGIKE